MGGYKVLTPERALRKLSFSQRQMLLDVDICGNVYALNYSRGFNIRTLRKLISVGLVEKECLTTIGVQTRRHIIETEGLTEYKLSDFPMWEHNHGQD
jgi:hypothetical protein